MQHVRMFDELASLDATSLTNLAGPQPLDDDHTDDEDDDHTDDDDDPTTLSTHFDIKKGRINA